MTDEEVTVRVTGRQFRHDGEEYHTGDTLEVPERAIEGWEARLERVDEDTGGDGDGADDDEAEEADAEAEHEEESSDDASGEDDGDAELDPHPGDLTIDELESRIEGVDDVDLLEEIRDAEEAADDRSGAKDAIEDRISDLTEE